MKDPYFKLGLFLLVVWAMIYFIPCITIHILAVMAVILIVIQGIKNFKELRNRHK